MRKLEKTSVERDKENQKIWAYAIYRVLMEHFSYAVCRSPINSKRLYLEYIVTSPNKRRGIWKRCRSLFDAKLADIIPEDFYEEQVSVFLISNSKGIVTNILVWGSEYQLSINCDFHGRRRFEWKLAQRTTRFHKSANIA